MLAEWPTPIQHYLQANYGPLDTQTQLFGLSTNRVWRIQTATSTLILKATAHPIELAFYRYAAPALHLTDVTPQLHWAYQKEDTHWLVLEDIPEPFPRTRWLADGRQLAILHRLHRSSPSALPSLADIFQPVWNAAMTEHALRHFATAAATALRPALDKLCEECQPLFAPRGWISGDPNPTNWGLRDNGTLVLYDWERFGRGTPALDLAIAVPGLGSPDEFHAVSVGYLAITAHGMSSTDEVAALTRKIALAKTWAIVEFLSNVTRGKVADTRGVAHLVAAWPDWLTQIAAG